MLTSGSVNTLVTVLVDVEKGTDRFKTCCLQLKTALVSILGVLETDVQIVGTVIASFARGKARLPYHPQLHNHTDIFCTAVLAHGWRLYYANDAGSYNGMQSIDHYTG